jgi:DNA segregation ATPase FtsK/SpoIIIE-like protein
VAQQGDNKMKKLLLGTMLLALIITAPLPTMAGVDIGISISLPPLLIFAGPPEVVVIPETNVYVVPDLDEDIYFYSGWWWRPWQGRWYRSRNYRSGWAYYQSVPSFYRGIPSGWRDDYRERRWRGREWNYQPIPHQQVQKNWRTWEKNKHWEKQNSWGVQGLRPGAQARPQSREAAQPQHREAVQPQRSQPQHQEAVQPQRPQPQHQEAAQPQRPQPQQREASQPQRSEPRQGKPEKGNGEKHDR